MFRKKDRIKLLVERNFELIKINSELVTNNKKIININSSLLKQLELKNNKLNEIKKYSKAIIDIWKDTESDTAYLMVCNFEHLLDILDGEDK